MSGNLIIKPITAKLKRDTEVGGKMDPYVILHLGGQKWKSHTHNDGGQNPSWNDQTQFRRTNEDLVQIEVWDNDFVSKDDMVAQGTFSLSSMSHGGQRTEWVPLSYKGKAAGEILLDFNLILDGGNPNQQNQNQVIGMSYQQSAQNQFIPQQQPQQFGFQQFPQQPQFGGFQQQPQQPQFGGFQQYPQQQQFGQPQQYPQQQQQFVQPQQYPQQQQFGYPQQIQQQVQINPNQQQILNPNQQQNVNVKIQQTNDKLKEGENLYTNQILWSQNGTFFLIAQNDDNLVLYKVPQPFNQSGQQPIWASNTQFKGKGSTRLSMQGDGNLVLYQDNQPLWSSKTNGKGSSPYHAIVQNDGNFVVYFNTSVPIWATNTHGR